MKLLANTVNLTINGKKYTVPNDLPPTTPLATFIRQHANLTGTKVFCSEGGCGACVVNVAKMDPASRMHDVRAVNSCMLPIYACDGLDIKTVEGIGNKKDGFHPVQQRLADFNGTQCGYCSPGMVMSMYSLLNSKADLTMKDVEFILDGNICRCTGYRPIMDAFKSFASDAPPELKQKVIDIEDVLKDGVCPKTMKACEGKLAGKPCAPMTCSGPPRLPPALQIDLADGKWLRPSSLEDLVEVIARSADQKIRYVVGNTGRGVYRDIELGDIYIDLNLVPEVFAVSTSSGLSIGAGVTLTRTIEILTEAAKNQPPYKYAAALARHLKRVANVPVRNAGSLGGNLMLKHAHKEFQSDIFTTFEAVGATVTLSGPTAGKTELPLHAILSEDMSRSVLVSIHLPPLSPDIKIRTFKITPRMQNAHAYVNAAFVADVQEPDAVVARKPSIVFGGIKLKDGYGQVHAKETEDFLNGKKLTDESVVQEALKLLVTEFVESNLPGESSFEYRSKLAQGLLYKFILGVLGNRVSEKLRSGAADLRRGLSSGKQEITTDPGAYPVSKPIPKIEAWNQTSGEAQYVNDIPHIPGELHAAFVGSTIGSGKIKSIDHFKALRAPGVVAFFSAKDIRGVNNFTPGEQGPEEVFASDKIEFHNQPIGLIVAETRDKAIAAAKLVQVEYSDVAKPVIDIRNILAEDLEGHKDGEEDRVVKHDVPVAAVDVEDEMTEAPQKITGEIEFGSQHHFHMETHVCLSRPTEDGVDVFCPTQWVDALQHAVAGVVGVPANTVHVVVRRCGGAYGGKITRPNQIAAACALASLNLRRPVRMALDMETNLSMVGKRTGYVVKYQAGFEDDGKLRAVRAKIYGDVGCSKNESPVVFATMLAQNCYFSPKWNYIPISVLTNTPSNTWTRSPGTTEGIAIIEHIMEHIAFCLKKDPLEVRQVNFIKEGEPDMNGTPTGQNMLPQMVEVFESSAELKKRKQDVQEFNQANVWKKRGLSVVPMKYPVSYPGFFKFAVTLAVFHEDGTIAVSHGACEMGQGLNTKVAQVTAKTLGVPMEKVIIKPTDSFTNANSSVTGGSMGSELSCYGVMKACEDLMARMQPVKAKEQKELTWEEWVKKAYNAGVDLRATYYVNGGGDDLKPYNIWGLACTEVEVDILTGEKQILRADILEDVGISLSPEVDIGQIEGAFVMGLGYWLQEEMKYDADTGRNLSNRTWEYKPPLNKDIPIDFRVSFLQNAPNPTGFLRSKATGEPSLCMSVCSLFAVKHAIQAARQEKRLTDWWLLSGPATNEKIRLSAPFTAEDFKLAS